MVLFLGMIGQSSKTFVKNKKLLLEHFRFRLKLSQKLAAGCLSFAKFQVDLAVRKGKVKGNL